MTPYERFDFYNFIFDVILFSIGFVLYEVYSFCVESHYMINVHEQKLNTEISPVKLNLLIKNN